MQTLELENATLLFDGQVLEVFSPAGSHRFLATRLEVRTHEDRKGDLMATFSPVGGQRSGLRGPGRVPCRVRRVHSVCAADLSRPRPTI